jgi:N-acetylneuraminic acid mutarotase
MPRSLAVLALLPCLALGCGADKPQVTEREQVVLTWDAPGPDEATLRYEAQGIAVGQKFYVFGGFFQGTGWPVTAAGEVFDLPSRTWSPIAPAPDALTHAGRAADARFIYVAGGFIGDGPGGSTDHTWKYDTVDDTWTSLPALPAQRGAGVLALLGTRLHYFGGAVKGPVGDTFESDHGEHWVLDVNQLTAGWVLVAPLPNPRNHLGGCAADGKIYAVGGQKLRDENAGNQASVHVYAPDRNEWTEVASLPLPIGHLTSNVVEYHGRVLAISGITTGSTKLATVFSFDPAAGAWTELTSLPEQRHSPVSGIIGNTLLVVGGSRSTSSEIRAQTWLGTLRLE